jgi:hypothetical protein
VIESVNMAIDFDQNCAWNDQFRSCAWRVTRASPCFDAAFSPPDGGAAAPDRSLA